MVSQSLDDRERRPKVMRSLATGGFASSRHRCYFLLWGVSIAHGPIRHGNALDWHCQYSHGPLYTFPVRSALLPPSIGQSSPSSTPAILLSISPSFSHSFVGLQLYTDPLGSALPSIRKPPSYRPLPVCLGVVRAQQRSCAFATVVLIVPPWFVIVCPSFFW
ncbi:hypothetical protein BCV70DRAFT_197930 [Testicularia cyperi]|uniref:Uncharacterized protein n=1 Tax=Testicularia cyperi TaxID=1882483 RepID=A0A317Y2D7_9BASI|nr:hypothetical protein BCV70DRAFT_197930 [Testicularia cyperi]